MNTVNVVIAGLGGQGIVKASDILSDAAFRAGHDVKKAEVHGMSQRGGSVNTDVRFGSEVLSPMVPDGEAHILVLVDPSQEPVNRHRLASHGVLLSAAEIDPSKLGSAKALNVAMLGLLSAFLDLDPSVWYAAIRAALPVNVHATNEAAFAYGRDLGLKRKESQHA